MGKFPNMGRCIISYLEVQRPVLKQMRLIIVIALQRSVDQDFGTERMPLFGAM